MARSYTQQTIKLLFGQASACAYPGCAAPLIFVDRQQRTVVAEIAHIRSERPDGPRHDPAYTGDINGPDNLLLLCGIHHKPVDRHESTYEITDLEVWKRAQVATAGAGTPVSDEEALAIVRIRPEERHAVDQIIRLSFRVERAAEDAADALGLVNHEHRRAREKLQAQLGPMWKVDGDGNQTPITSMQLPPTQQAAFRQRLETTFQERRPRVREIVGLLGEEMSVLRAMDPLLGGLANQVVLAAELLPDVFHEASVLEQTIDLLQNQVRRLSEAAQERY